MTTSNSFDEISVSWQLDDIDVNASLTRPATGDGLFPSVIMVAGSGPTDRNWNSPLIPGTNGSARLLARALADLGYVTLRYDKRASGPHGPENARRMMGRISMQGHWDELAGGVKLLTERQEVDPRRIIALTNSEGCIHAANYQLQVPDLPLAALILTSAPARSIGEVARGQIEAQLKPIPGGETWLAAYDVAMADFAAGRAVNVDESLPEGLRALILGATSPINQPFARELWVTTPVALIAKISAPILIVLGKKDIQVDWQADGALFEEAAKVHRNITVAYAENANHVLKYEPRQRSQLTAAEVTAAYNADGQQLDTQIMDTITTWLAAHELHGGSSARDD
jgi:uncharacterized protein